MILLACLLGGWVGCVVGRALPPPRRRRGWTWSREPGLPPQDEILPALVHTGYASKRLAMCCYSGRDVMEAIRFAEIQLLLAKRHIKIVDPDEPSVDEPNFML